MLVVLIPFLRKLITDKARRLSSKRRLSFLSHKRRVTDSVVATSLRDVFGGAGGFTEANEANEESGELNGRQKMMKNTGLTGSGPVKGDDRLAQLLSKR
jgi:hypothetical protein